MFRRLKCCPRAFAILIAAWAATLEPVQAQVTAAISGRVEDASGAAVEGAIVTVKSLETGASRAVTTGATGNFRAVSLPIGPQDVRAEKTGFKATVRSGINLEVGQEAVVTLQLEVGELVQEVRTVAETSLVNTTTAEVSGLVGEREVKDLPLNGRSFDNLLTLNPGVINYSSMKSANTTTSSGNTFSVAGRRTGDNLFLLNGVEYTGTSQLAVSPGGVSGDLLGIDAIREFNVLTGTYPAEYGKRAGAQVSVVTQSGSNQFHGSLFEFLRSSALDARNFFDQGPVPPFERNQFGGSAGGPLKKDRLFSFANYEGFRQRLGLSDVTIVPDDQARQGLLPNASGVYSQVANLNPAILQFMPLWPRSNGPELLVNGQPSGIALSYSNPRQTIREDFGTVRTDYALKNHDSLSAVYTLDDGYSLTPAANPLFALGLRLRSQVLSLHETHTVSPRILNTFIAGFSRANYNIDSIPLATFSPNLSFVTGAGVGGITVTGITGTGNTNNDVWNRRSLFTYTDSLQISRGIHQISLGVWFQRLQHNDHTASRTQGAATFLSMPLFLQGNVNNFQVTPNPTEVGWRSLLGAWYIEDSMRLRHNLTFQVGIRHEFTTGWNEVAGRASNYVTDAQGVLLTDPRVGSTEFTKNNAKWLFGPRAALAWDLAGNGKTAIRAGFGIYYSLIDNLTFLLNSIPPFDSSVTFTGNLFSFLPITPRVQPPPACGPAVQAPCSIFAPQGVEAAAKTPAVNEWNFTIERQLGSNTAFRAGYIGSFGYHGLLSVDPNTIPAQICSTPGGCRGGTVPAGVRYIPVQPAPVPPAASTRPNPYVGAGFFWFTEGNSSYNGLQLEVTRRLSRGLQFRGSYTWSKNLDINSALTIAQAQNQPQLVMDRNDLRRDWGPSALTPTSQASISAHYELPFGDRKAGGLANKLISGWQLNGITTLLSGFPFTPLIGSNRSGDGNTRNPDRPSFNPSYTGSALIGKQTKWFDPNAFVLPPAGTWGNLGREAFRGPNLVNMDLSLLKNIAVSEKTNVQFRTEFFNALNRTNLGTPGSTVFSGSSINPSAGLITATATTSRQIQFALKLMF
jgi:hypothetical protein